MTRWTVTLDESGSFEDRLLGDEKDESLCVIAAVLAPAAPEDLDAAWRQPANAICINESIAFPPHANKVPAHQRTRVLESLVTLALSRDARIVVVAEPVDCEASIEDRLVRYVRLLGETVDIVGRVASVLGATKLAVCPAQRTLPLSEKHAQTAERHGVSFQQEGDVGDTTWMRSLVHAEVRQVLEALGREDRGSMPELPALSEIIVASADSVESHPGLWIADFVANYARDSLRARPTAADATRPLGGDERALILERSRLRSVRDVDRALRANPPDLVAAATAWQLVRARSDAASETVVRGAANAAALVWQKGTRRLVVRSAAAIAWSLAARADAVLGAKQGDYEGAWAALEAGWSGESELAKSVRAGVSDRLLAARLWRCAMECANHRGDIAAAMNARVEFEHVAGPRDSFALRAEELLVTNLAVVIVQNRLPPPDDECATTMATLASETTQLEKRTDEVGALLALDPAVPESFVGEDDDARLWELAGGKPEGDIAVNVERAMNYGTVARSRAFLGDFDEALRVGLKARALFGDAQRHRVFNASVLARIEIERARLAPDPERAELRAELLRLAGVDIGSTRWARENELRSEPSRRFALDLALRALLWVPETFGRRDLWVQLLERDGVVAELEAAPSHPTELVARHAAELLRKAGRPADRWWTLARRLAESAAPTSTLARLGAFSAQLADDPAFVAEGPAGSVLNPTFEYR